MGSIDPHLAEMARVERPTPALSLWALATGNFAIGTGSLVIAGLLPGMAADLGRSASAIGQTVTAFAIAVAVGGPALAALTSRIDRRRVLTLGLLLFAAGTLMSALATGYQVLLAARVLAGLGASLFTPHASATAAMLVPPDQRGRAIALVFGGFTVATVLGLPLGTLLGAAIGWRAALAVLGIVALAAPVILWRVLPADLFTKTIMRADWARLLGSRAILLALAVTLFQMLGQLALFTYIAPLFNTTLGAGTTMISALLLWLGIAGVTGNALAGRMIDRIGAANVAHLSIGAVGAGFILLAIGAHSLPVAVIVCFIWGVGGFAVNTSQQARLVAAAPTLSSASLPLNSSAVYTGQALGAAAGGAAIGAAGVGSLPVIAAIFMIVSLVVSLLAARPD
jgi:multidrug resistance protein